MRSLLASFIALLLLAPAATAKELASADVCGASGCRSVEDRRTREALLAGGKWISPPRSGPFYTARFTVRGAGAEGRGIVDRFEVTYLPSARAVRTTDERGEPVWQRIGAGAERAYRSATWNLRPLPASRIGEMGEPIRAAVDEVYCPACPSSTDGGWKGPATWTLAIGAAAVSAALGVGLVLLRRRHTSMRRRSGAGATAAEAP